MTTANERLRILMIAAHPDEADMYAGGTAALLADRGHLVKFLSLTSGDAGHFELPREPLTRRRAKEAYEAARFLGVAEYEILDTHDGELEATVEVRKQVIRVIREWQADIVISLHDDAGGHLDNRAAGRAARHGAHFSALPNLVPERPALQRHPICLLMTDYAAVDVHRHDVVIDVAPTIERKLRACGAHASQFFETAPQSRRLLDKLPAPGDWDGERAFILDHWPEFMYAQDGMRESLAERSGAPVELEYAESFQIADYGRPTTVDEVYALLTS